MTSPSSFRLLRRAFSTSLEASDSVTSLKSAYDSLYKERSLKRLVAQFKKSSAFDHFRTKIGTYQYVVRRLASARRFDMIEEILEEQKKYGDISKEGFAVRLISLYGKSGMFENAQKLFDEMPELTCERTVLSLNAHLGACVNSKKFDMMEELFRELPGKLSIDSDSVTYNTAIKGYCAMGSLDSAISLLDEMENRGLEPGLVTFNTLLSGLYLGNRTADGDTIWARMEEKNIVPDVRSYNAKLFGLVSQKKMKEAVETVEEMRMKGINPDIFSFNALIKGFAECGNLNDAKLWYSEIGKSNFDPDKTTYGKLIPLACQKGDVDFAYELCEEIFNIRCLVDGALLQLVVDLLVKESRIEEVEKLVQLGKINKYRRYSLRLPAST